MARRRGAVAVARGLGGAGRGVDDEEVHGTFYLVTLGSLLAVAGCWTFGWNPSAVFDSTLEVRVPGRLGLAFDHGTL